MQAPLATEVQPSATEQDATSARQERRHERESRSQERERVGEPDAPVAESADDAELAVEERRAERRREREQRRAQPQVEPTSPTVAPSDSAVEQQIIIQRGEEELRELRRLREKLEQERQLVEDLQDEAEEIEIGSDARAERRRERERRLGDRPEAEFETRTERRGDRRDRRDGRGDHGEVVERQGDRIIIRLGDQLIIQPQREGDRLLSRARDVRVEDLGYGNTRTTVFRENGVRVITDRDRYGDILTRIRILPNGEEIILIDNVYAEEYAPRRTERRRFYAEIEELPPLVLRIPQEEYIVETRSATRQAVREALVAPPVEAVERVYTLDEVRFSERLRDMVRRVDLDTITFEFGSAAVSLDQLDALDSIGLALEDLLAQNPDEVFLIEGHTDAVGSHEANLVLSDRRAEAVAVALSEDFDIPPENLVTQGYGKQQLKINTPAPERENRRVAVRRITPLLRAER